MVTTFAALVVALTACKIQKSNPNTNFIKVYSCMSLGTTHLFEPDDTLSMWRGIALWPLARLYSPEPPPIRLKAIHTLHLSYIDAGQGVGFGLRAATTKPFKTWAPGRSQRFRLVRKTIRRSAQWSAQLQKCIFTINQLCLMLVGCFIHLHAVVLWQNKVWRDLGCGCIEFETSVNNSA